MGRNDRYQRLEHGLGLGLRVEPKPGRCKKECILANDVIFPKKSLTQRLLRLRVFRFWLFPLLLFFLLISGCDYHEVEAVTIVSGIGVIMEGDTMVVHLELIEKGRIPSEGEGIKTIITKGERFGDAIRNIVLQNGKRPYFGHTQVLIVDEGALAFLPDIVDDLLAQKEIRYDLQIVLANDAIDALFERNEELRAFDLYELLKMNRYAATSMSLRLLDYMKQQEASFLLPIVTMEEEQATLKEGAMLVVKGNNREVDARFVSAYLMLDGLFEFSIEMIEKEDGKSIYSELSNVKTKYRRIGNEALLTIKGTLFITQEDKDGAIKQMIQQKVLEEVTSFLIENEEVALIDVSAKLGSRRFMESPNQPVPEAYQVAVDIQVVNASNVRKGQ